MISSCDFIGVITVIEVIIDFEFLTYRSKECRVQLPFLTVGKGLLSEKSRTVKTKTRTGKLDPILRWGHRIFSFITIDT